MNTILGIDKLESVSSSFKGQKIALITNYSGINSSLEENIKLFLDNGLDIVKVFAPEHGIYGIADGEAFEDMIHPVYKIPVISLYGNKKKPRTEDLMDVDMIVYDIQDVGLRYYTYIYTLAYSLEAAHENSKKFVVLDRPNPLGCEIVSGNRMPKNYSSFVGDYALPIRYGLTPGEIGRYFIKFMKLDVDYDVVKMENYTRNMYYPDTNLHWNLPSPALPNFESVQCYYGGCFMEAVNISEGRGTSKPFQMYGAPWIDMYSLKKKMDDDLPQSDFDYRERAFVPFYSKYKDEVCFGLEFFPKTNDADFLPVILKFMKNVFEMHSDKFEFIKYADVARIESLTGDRRVVDYFKDVIDLSELLECWKAEVSEFKAYTEELKLY